MTCDTDRLLAFLSDELDEPERTSYDDHLLGCEACWTAVRDDRRGRALAELLREPAPAGLAERIRLAAEAERRRRSGTRARQTTPGVVGHAHVEAPLPSGTPARRTTPVVFGHAHVERRRRWAVAAASLGAAAAALAGVLLATAPSRRPPGPGPAGMAATLDLVRLGAALPAHLAGSPSGAQAPRMIGTPMTMSMDSLQVHVAWYGVDGGEALVAHSDQPFAMPAGGTPSADGKSWTAQMDGVSIYCACRAGAPAAAIVTPMRPHAALDLAAYLGMPT